MSPSVVAAAAPRLVSRVGTPLPIHPQGSGLAVTEKGFCTLKAEAEAGKALAARYGLEIILPPAPAETADGNQTSMPTGRPSGSTADQLPDGVAATLSPAGWLLDVLSSADSWRVPVLARQGAAASSNGMHTSLSLSLSPSLSLSLSPSLSFSPSLSREKRNLNCKSRARPIKTHR